MKFSFIFLFLLSFTIKAEGLSTMAEWAKATPPSATMSAAYFHIHNSGKKDIDLVSATTPSARIVEIHTHTNDKGVMKMRKVEKLNVPANGMVELVPGGNHLMLIGLKKGLKAGETINLNLVFSNGKKLDVKARVKMLEDGGGHHHH